MGIDLPGRFRNANVALVIQFEVYLFIFGVFVGDDGLLVGAGHAVAVREVPHSLAIGLVVRETSLIVGAVIWEDPPSFDELIVRPVSHQFVPSIVVDIRAVAVFLAEHPPACVDILVRIRVGALSMLHSVLPVTLDKSASTVVFALILAGKPANSVLFISHEGSLVAIAICVEVFAIAFTLAIDVCAEVLIVIGVEGVSEASEIS